MPLKHFLTATFAALALATPRAHAAFVFWTQQTAITTGPFAGLDRVNLVLTSDLPSYTIGAVAFDAVPYNPYTGPITNGLKFNVPSLGNPDVYSPTGISDVLAHAFDPGAKGTFAGLSDGVNLATPEPNAANKPAYSAGLDKLSIVGFYTTPLTITKADAPSGIVIGSAVVERGAWVVFTGNVDNDLDPNNGNTQFNIGFPIPEPTAPATLALAGALLLTARRHRPNPSRL